MSGVAPSPNGTVVGRYMLYDEIAAGGMATIHIGRLLADIGGFSRTVAVKRLLPQFAKDAEFVNMFLEEARLAARIRHANVVQVLDVVSTDHELFLVMEFIQGETITRLTRVNRKRARIVPMNIALAIMVDALQGLHAAHEAKDEAGRPLDIVHRDISPHNIMVGHDGRARVLDFGIAKASSSSQSTREGEVKGKFAYMSPEQLSSVVVDRRADVFAASIVLWEMVTGHRLFQAPDPAAIVGRVLTSVIQKPSVIAAGLPPALDDIVLEGLARDRDQRYSSALEMARAIEASGLPIARTTEVAAWVNRIAGDTLKQRQKRISEIESTGSFSASNALAASNALSQRDVTGSGSGSNSRSMIRPKSDRSIPVPTASSSMPALPPDIFIDTDDDEMSAPRKSRGKLIAVIALLAIASGVGVFVWRSGGIKPARERVAAIFRPPVPHGQIIGSSSPSATTPSGPTATAQPSTTLGGVNAIDITSGADRGPMPKFRGRTYGGGGTNAGGAQNGGSGANDPRVATHAPTGGAGGSGGDLNEAMHNASGGGIGVGQNAIVEAPKAPTGAVPSRPSLGQVHAAIGSLMGSARACFNPDDPPSHANVTFQSDGSVKGISVTGFAAGKPQEQCVKGMLAKAHVEPFSDATYAVPVTINP